MPFDANLADAAIDRRVQKDKWNNDVSIITMPSGKRYRMVHHTESGRYKQRATIYADRGVFMKYESYASDNDCQANTVKVGHYRVDWGDGDNLGATNEYVLGPDPLKDDLGTIWGDNFNQVLMTVLEAAENDETMWDRKPVVATA